MRKTLGTWLFSVIFVAFISSGCSSNDKPSEEQPALGKLDQLLTNIQQDGNYVFDGLPWLTAKEDVMEERKLSQASSNGDSITVEGKFPLDDSVKQLVVYRFQDDQLVSGEYLFSMTDKNHFAALCNELKELVSKSLEKPISNDLNVLDDAETSAEQGKVVMWEGKDRSNLRISLLTTTNNGKSEYLLQIQTTSPLPERKDLNS
ncbi:hypothetical protein PACILC2_25340 [Paenibacillus cisolokensis]|uniref:Lipoprotein n=1 Tax=Paenibacillus cisolokensis TaxID=1658519 RepID=A0ABQ4N712_9BACL|nr:hypothetical protein [Paenibacillus cisolokensis]GIQ63966.1 hypothetical protein PACILC2_25340 [Paenibacillus cisolokensis]